MQTTPFNTYFPDSLLLETPRVKLRLMQMEDFESLQTIAQAPDLWKYFTKNLAESAELKLWMKEALQEREEGKRMPFVVYDKDEQKICGCTSFMNFSFYDQRVEIGGTWLGEDFVGTGINRQAKFALLSYAFGVLKMERVELKTDNLNERAKSALRKIGAKEEGVLRSHMLMQNNRRRDSVYFSIIKEEWDKVRRNYFGDLI
ncbi:MAG TPA: GNAT family protein [Chitinophagaceae bacterium]|nr:GNAT family protein [Chitinophagaceae bacterium]